MPVVQEKADEVSSQPPLITRPFLDSASCETAGRQILEDLPRKVGNITENISAAQNTSLFCSSLPDITMLVQPVEENLDWPISPFPNTLH